MKEEKVAQQKKPSDSGINEILTYYPFEICTEKIFDSKNGQIFESFESAIFVNRT